jgi:hypothetical protein
MKKSAHKVLRRIDRIISGPLSSQLSFFGCAAAGIFLLLFILSAVLYPAETSLARRFWLLLHNFIAVNGFDDTDGVAPVLIFIANITGGVFFGSLLVAALVNIFRQREARICNGEVYYDFKRHIVIIGFDPMVAGLIRQLMEQSRREIVLQTVREVPEVRHLLFKELSAAHRERITIVSGNRTQAEDMEKLAVRDCAMIFLLGESGEDDRDSQNIECLKVIASLIPSGQNKRCHVLFDRRATFAAFQQQDLGEIREYIDFVPFNFCDMWAKKVFVDRKYRNGNSEELAYTPLDRLPIGADSEMRVHLVILGMTEMGIALGVQAAHICHFPNFFTRGIKTRITFIDNNAKQEMEYLQQGSLRNLFAECGWVYKDIDAGIERRGPSKATFTDIEFEFINARFEQEEIQKRLAELSSDKKTLLTIAVTPANQAKALAAGLYLPEAVYDSETSVLIRQELSCATVTMLSRRPETDAKTAYRKYRNIRPFGMFAGAYDVESADDLLSMMVKYTYDNTSDESAVREFSEEAVRKNWVENWRKTDNVSALKASNRYCAASITVKMRSLDIKAGEELTKEQIHYAARIEHQRWLTEKLIIGYRAPAPEEAEEIKADKQKRAYYKNERFVHTDIKPYDELEKDEKDIDVRIYDLNISRSLPFMLNEYERIKRPDAR